MKKLLLASAVAALSVTAAQAAPTVYGKAFLTLDLNDGNTDVTRTTGATATTSSADWNSRSQLNSNGSRIGLRGAEALTANTDLVYQLEYGIDVDANTNYDSNGNAKGQFYSRDTYLGLANEQYGTLLAGRLTAIDDMINYANVTAGGVLGGDDVLASFNAPRANNAFAYVSPSYNGLNFLGMYVMDEFTGAEFDANRRRLNNNGSTDTLGRDAFGVGVQYTPAGQAYRAGATYIQSGDLKFTRLSGDYKLNPALTVGALYQLSDYTDNNENAFTVSGQYKVAQTPWTTYAQVDWVDNVLGASNADTQRLVVGGKYAFNTNTTGHIYGAYLNGETTTTNGATTVKTETDGFGIGGGIEYKF